ncbi:extracellular solute-binding protein [Tuwongella immobilis]|uniref:ABC transporter substrate-binding protein n=1 Tax=Tuwongella immobilis TaxID=692036 RepID=A0A6C2YHX6_9BACT|nr:extracellular solute-binding protein [Tuwongella immobilis]VIP00869.1 ABC-type Fe3+ transport system, periplasmic component OS=Singulisphaera acidiphila (strain ATCC BAA-1392 / DSM 18658 / VKM B-2454 / MOB10) GN=Sinac_4929 PE=4 SV=1: SBP_bac_6 [Tuwongella immobilis]VTR97156.1 ABC-type Fe3+ transport system, periplasmic component OS=Singulisphaera acidiphila (strain ATCC BAA-1392 / DSM 18658 / VKM B-2454 / MOB10) GN=Sinac_4929 PE=4 SV=1: SBP_bac_6 [Tuwongella immobilis]
MAANLNRRHWMQRSLGMVAGAGLLNVAGCQRDDVVTVYCAQDREFAADLFTDFTRLSGVEVRVKYDTEANKSVGLIQELIQEGERPRCDVHWNNEILGTLRLQSQGLLARLESPRAMAFPEWTHPPEQTWQAFAARARVLIVHSGRVAQADRPASLWDLLHPRWKGQVAMAKPQFGTTATHAACLFQKLGTERASEFYRGLAANGVQLVAGNKQVAEQVAAGRFAMGMTDTDDALIEIQAGKPVEMVFLDRTGGPANAPELGTLFIPNTLAVIRNAPHSEAAQRLVDYLLQARVEQRLAEGGGYQIPLATDVTATLPGGLETPKSVKPLEVNWTEAAAGWDRVQAFLRDQFAG